MGKSNRGFGSCRISRGIPDFSGLWHEPQAAGHRDLANCRRPFDQDKAMPPENWLV
jgi:hypothetical protein